MSTDITSSSNPRARYVRRLASRAFRAREGKMVLEGVRLVEEALAAGAVFDFALTTAELEAGERGRRLARALAERRTATYRVPEALLAALADTVTPQGVLAVVAQPCLPLPARPTAVLVLDGLRDPGNVGTCLRSALAAGVDAALLGPNTADPSNAKAVRAAGGAHFRLPMARAAWSDTARRCRAAGLEVRVADAGGSADYAAIDWRRPFALVIGGEADGPSGAARALCTTTVRVPMPGGAESLNAAAAAAVILFEAARQRRQAC